MKNVLKPRSEFTFSVLSSSLVSPIDVGRLRLNGEPRLQLRDGGEIASTRSPMASIFSERFVRVCTINSMFEDGGESEFGVCSKLVLLEVSSVGLLELELECACEWLGAFVCFLGKGTVSFLRAELEGCELLALDGVDGLEVVATFCEVDLLPVVPDVDLCCEVDVLGVGQLIAFGGKGALVVLRVVAVGANAEAGIGIS